MPHTSIHWLLLALPFLATVWATGGAGLGRKRDESTGPDDGPPGPLPEAERALTQVRAHVGNLNDRLASLDSRLQMLGESNKQLVNILRSCTAQLCLSNAEVGNWKDELACARNKQSQLEAQIAEQRQELERGAQQLRSAQEELAARTQAAQAAAEQLAEAERSLPARALELEESVRANQHELTERSAQLVQARQRCDELELRLEQREEELRQQIEARRSAESHAGELERSQPALVGGLEARVAQRDEELRQRAAALENLRGELAASAARGAELEEELRLQQNEQRRSEARLRELEQALPTRSAELETRIAQRDEELRRSWEQCRELEGRIAQREEELRERLQQCGQLEARTSQRDEELRERSRRIDELEEELRAEVQEQRAVQASAGELEQELMRRIAELEERAARREEELSALRGECTELSARCEALARTAGSRARELDEHEYKLAQANARIGELEAEVQRNAGQRAGERLPMDELAEMRLASILHGYAGQSPKPLPPAYLERVKERDLSGALCSLLGGPEPLSADSLLALGENWALRHAAWNSEPIVGEVVYLWADACYVRTGLEQEGEALLVIVAGMVDGTRRVVSVEVGARESAEAWHASLSNLARRGMSAPRLVIGEDGLGLWSAMAQLGWNCAQQRCWDPRIAHAVEPLPKRQQRKAAELLRAISNCDTRAEACARKAAWVKKYRARRPEAVARLDADWERMLGLYSFPEEHWPHLRNTAVVESLLGELRLYTNQSKAQPRTPNGRAILWKLLLVGAQGLRKINSPQLLPAVAAAEPCIDGAFVVKSRRRAS